MDPAVLESLQKWAQDEFRSLNGQIECLLQRALRDAGRLPNRRGKTDEGDGSGFR